MNEYKKFTYEIGDIYNFDSFGGINFFDILTEDFLQAGYKIGDLVKISFLNKSIVVPVVRDFNQIELEHTGLTISNLDAVFLKIFTFGGMFSLDNNLVERNNEPRPLWKLKNGLSFPIVFTIEMYQPGGYNEELKIFNLSRTNNRDDYKELNDAEFGNFREVNYAGIKSNILYRGSSPIDPKLNRNILVDNELKKHGIKTILNYVNKQEKAEEFIDFSSSYYSKQDVLYIPLPVYFFDSNFTNKVRDSLLYLIDHKGPYFIHCWEGKDRTGFIVAIIECLCGVSIDDIKEDYAMSFINFFKVQKGSDAYKRFTNRIVRLLSLAFEIKTIDYKLLPSYARKYLIKIGLNDAQINRLIKVFKNND